MLKNSLILAVLIMTAASLAACEIRVARDENREPMDIDVETPFGDLSVTKDAIPEDVGVAVYPGAKPLEDGDETDRANVSIQSPFVGLQVVALKYTSDDTPDAIAEFYRGQLAKYGQVTVCRGNLDFEDSDGANGPRCKRPRGNDQVQVGVGSKGQFRVASVKSRGKGSEFAVVYVRASNDL